jgi:uncharacterized protein (TIGR00645 family)
MAGERKRRSPTLAATAAYVRLDLILGHMMRRISWIEHALEVGIFQARWLVAPFYVGLVAALVLLLGAFVREIYLALFAHFSLETDSVVLLVLSLIDLSLAANLVIIVVFSGYENFVSKINTAGSEDRPSWMGTLDFSGLKMKLIGSIVAISAISLLHAFMELLEPGVAPDAARLGWMIGLHVTFLFSGVMFALMDWIASKSEGKPHRDPAAP